MCPPPSLPATRRTRRPPPASPPSFPASVPQNECTCAVLELDFDDNGNFPAVRHAPFWQSLCLSGAIANPSRRLRSPLRTPLLGEGGFNLPFFSALFLDPLSRSREGSAFSPPFVLQRSSLRLCRSDLRRSWEHWPRKGVSQFLFPWF